MQFLTTALITSEVSEVAEGLCNIQGQFQLSKHHLHSVPCVCSLCNVEVQSEPPRAPTFLVFPSSHSYIAMGILLCFPNGSCFCKVDCLQKSGFNIHYVWIWSYELRLLFFFFHISQLVSHVESSQVVLCSLCAYNTNNHSFKKARQIIRITNM